MYKLYEEVELNFLRLKVRNKKVIVRSKDLLVWRPGEKDWHKEDWERNSLERERVSESYFWIQEVWLDVREELPWIREKDWDYEKVVRLFGPT